jgi:hypothetical protein
LWYNAEIHLTQSSWTAVTGQPGKYVSNVAYYFSDINKYPLVYFVDDENKQIWDLPVQFLQNVNQINVYSNVKIEGMLIISSGSGYKE